MARADLLLGLELAHQPPQEGVLAWPDQAPPPAALLGVLRRAHLPGLALVCGPASTVARAALASPLAAARGPVDGRPTAFVCEHGACHLPVFDPVSLSRLVGERKQRRTRAGGEG
jgi:uncharacterized protein YyaL (SSP411 family)